MRFWKSIVSTFRSLVGSGSGSPPGETKNENQFVEWENKYTKMLADLDRLKAAHEKVAKETAVLANIVMFLDWSPEHQCFVIRMSDVLLMSNESQRFLNSIKEG